MGIPIQVPGLDTILPEVQAGRIALVESGPDPAKSFFVRSLALSARSQGLPVTFLTSRDKEEVERLLGKEGPRDDWAEGAINIVELDALKDWSGVPERGGLLSIDSFSFLTLDLGPSQMATLMRQLRTVVRAQDMTVVLSTDRGMFESRSEAVATHLSDGVIQFHSRETPEGLTRFIRIPKWTDGRFVDRNIYYDFDGKRMAIDLRRRVL